VLLNVGCRKFALSDLAAEVVGAARTCCDLAVNYENGRDMMMKKLRFVVLFMLCLFAIPGISQAASPVSTHIYLDGHELTQPEKAQAGIVNGNVMVPLRVVLEGLGYDVAWEKKTGSVTVSQADTTLKFVIGEKLAQSGDQEITLRAAPFLQNNTTLIPLRFVGEEMGLQVSWDNKTKSAHLYSPDGGSGSGVGGGKSASNPNEEGGTPENVPQQGNSNGGGSSVPSTTQAMLNGISFSDNRLQLSASSDIEPSVFKMDGPNRIVIDLPQTSFSEQFASALPLDDTMRGEFAVTDHPSVSQIRYALFTRNPDTVRIVLDLKAPSPYSVTRDGLGLITIDLTESTVVTPPPSGGNGKRIVVIDPGHGGKQPGAISKSKKQEKDFTLAVGLKVQALLEQEQDIDFVLTRTTDVTVSLQDRAKLANDLNADIFISIHGNSIDPPANPSGSETYYTREESIPLANVMHKHLVAATGLADRKVRYSSLHVTRETKMPAVLLEVGYLSHDKDDALMYSEDFQQSVAEGIVAGIKEYLGL